MQVERIVELQTGFNLFFYINTQAARDTQFTLPCKDQAGTVLLLGGNEKINKETEV